MHEKARELGIPLVMPKTLRIPAAETLFASHRADVAVVVAYGLILPKADPRSAAPRLPEPACLAASPLARRGTHTACDHGRRRETGVMAMRMEEGLDTGPVCLTERVAIGADETAGELHDRLAPLGAELMARALRALEAGTLACTPQAETGVTYAKKIEKAETRIDWQRPAAESTTKSAASRPFPAPGSKCRRGGERVKVLGREARSGAGSPARSLASIPLSRLRRRRG